MCPGSDGPLSWPHGAGRQSVVSVFDQPIDRSGTSSYKWDAYPADVLPLWVADMGFAAPPAVIAALQARTAHGVFGYTNVPVSLVAAIRDHLAHSYGWRIEEDWLIFLPGVEPALNLACRAYAGRGEEVATVTPAYPPFLEAPPQQRRRLLTVPAVLDGRRWRLPLEALEAAFTPQTKLLILCHPHNPVGRVWDAEEVAAVADLCRRREVVLLSDEIHCDLLIDGQRHLPAALAGGGDITMTLMSPSKTFNLPGLDFAFAVIPDETLRRRFETAAAGVLPMVNPLSAVAAEAAYREAGPWLAGCLSICAKTATSSSGSWPRSCRAWARPTSRRPTWRGSTCATPASKLRPMPALQPASPSATVPTSTSPASCASTSAARAACSNRRSALQDGPRSQRGADTMTGDHRASTTPTG